MLSSLLRLLDQPGHKLHRRALGADLRKSPVDYFSAGLVDDDNPFEWDITIIGPVETLLCAAVCGCASQLLCVQPRK